MVVFVDGYGFAFGLNDVQRKAIADVQPGMEAIFERFVQKCKLKNLMLGIEPEEDEEEETQA